MGTGALLSETALKTIDQAMQHALACHKDGKLQEAEKLYQVILQIDPDHPKANHNMGSLLLQKQQTAASLPYFTAALDAEPAHGQYWLSYIDALFQDGQLETARQILALARQQGLQGENVDEMALRLSGGDQKPVPPPSDPHESRAPTPAAPVMEHGKPGSARHKPDTLNKKPAPGEINSLLALVNKGKEAEAIKVSRKMTVEYPHHGTGWKVLGALLSRMGKNQEALLPMQKAAELLPQDAEARNNLGITLQELGRLDEAIASYQLALEINPDYAEAHNGLGHIFQLKGMLGEAESSYRRAIRIKPDFSDALNKLGTVLKVLGRLDEAGECFQRAIRSQPDNADAHNNLGSVHVLTGRLEEAEACFRRAIQIKPDLAVALSNLGSVMYDLGHLDEAEEFYKRALQIDPDNDGVYSNLLFCLSQDASMDPRALFLEHCRFGERFESGLGGVGRQHSNSRDPERTLQIGVVSGDLRQHAVAFFFEPVLECLSGDAQFSLHAYSNHNMDDSVTARLRGHFPRWTSIAGMPDDVLAEKIRADGIDILIDLSNHTSKNRLLAFARKPAPVQVTWIGYPGTTGMKSMDYYLSDRFALPPGQFDDQFTEKIVHLPASAPFLPSKDAPPVKSLPALGNGYVTFGSFNRVSKLNPTIIALWSQLLRALPDSRMLLGGMPEVGGYESLIEWFAQEGIARDRLDFHPRSSMDRYLDLHHQVDICLDTFPYSGGTTTLHALWMGVPTLTLAGTTIPGRTGVTLLCHAGLEAFIATDAADFVQKGLRWAGDLKGLSAVRATVRETFANSAMGQPQVVGASVAQALRIMWQRWCAGLPTESFEVKQPGISNAAKGGGQMTEPKKASPIYVTQPLLPPLEEFIPYLQKIWDSKQLTNNGPYHQQLEQELAQYLGVEHISLFANATLALVTALQALRVTGEVITTPYSFVASSHALDWNGIRPVFVDIDPVTLNLDPKQIEAAITPQTTGILPVHVYGVPCDVEAIEHIADTYGLKVIYDAAHTFGMRLNNGHSVLEYGDMSILSFHATKVFNTFEGGAIICRDAKTKHRIDYLKNFGFADEVTVIGPGINGKMNEVQAAFGLLQLKYIDDALERRKQVDARYREKLGRVHGIRMHRIPDDIRYNYPYFPIFIEDEFPVSRDELYRRLRECGIYARRYFYPLISEFPVYRGLHSAAASNLPVASDISHRVLCLPIYPDLDESTQDDILACLLRTVKKG